MIAKTMLAADQGAKPFGWLDGFCAQPAGNAGHEVVSCSGGYALVWRGASQGGMAAMVKRLMMASMGADIVPARIGQAVPSVAVLRGRLGDGGGLKQLLAALGQHWQFSVMLPFHAPPVATSNASLRAKHAAQRAHVAALNASVAPEIKQFAAQIAVRVLRPQPCSPQTAALHCLVPKPKAQDVSARWAQMAKGAAHGALIGPLPPFAFLNESAAL